MVILTLIVSMGVILFLVSKKVNIGYSLVTGAVILALLNKRGIVYILRTFFITLGEETTYTLAITIGLISVLGYVMQKYQILDRMISALESMLRSTKATILIAPALIGTLLVTGGALMSCPVVDTLGDRLGIPKHKRAAINQIFRHALFFIFPLSPSLILASKLGDIAIWDFIKLQFPMAIALYVFGFVFYLRGYKEPDIPKTDAKTYIKSVGNFLVYASPILVSIFGVLILNLPFYISLLAGLAFSIVINIFDKGRDEKYDTKEPIYKTLYKGLKPSMMIAMVGIMMFKNVVNDIDEIYIQLNNLLEAGMPVELLIMIGCLLISLPLATTQPSIAILYPMLLPLAPNYDAKLGYAMFIYTSAFVVYFISPLHMCQVLTVEYFEVKLKNLYKNYIYILPLTYLVMVVIYLISN
jgi:uncharacterized protein